ncbi:MAG: MFS transporter [Oscillospiraceae bacterium]|jgi:fucose permease|nr:MFS transporter [Oscillospiraceae bacterium]
MFSLLIAIIYLAFVGLGLPDSMLGAAWPSMHLELGVPLSFAGIVSMIIALGTIVSSLLSERLTKKLGAGLVTAISVGMTAGALLGFSLSGSFVWLCIFAVPYGLGAGAVDAALNNYVALHYASRHMNWLHCFWGVGAIISPYIMGNALSSGTGWQSGYQTVAIIQIILTATLFLSLPLWKGKCRESAEQIAATAPLTLGQIFKIRGAKFVLLAFLGYCALEVTASLWTSSYLVLKKGVSSETAAKYASFFFLGITVGRFLCGFISDKIGSKNMIRIGLYIIFAGVIAVWIPMNSTWLCLNGLIVIGLGCAPIYPSIIHATPQNFGKENSQAMIGVQMASAYVGSTLMPPLFGLLKIGLLPVYMLLLAALMLLMTERLNRVTAKQN